MIDARARVCSLLDITGCFGRVLPAHACTHTNGHCLARARAPFSAPPAGAQSAGKQRCWLQVLLVQGCCCRDADAAAVTPGGIRHRRRRQPLQRAPTRMSTAAAAAGSRLGLHVPRAGTRDLKSSTTQVAQAACHRGVESEDCRCTYYIQYKYDDFYSSMVAVTFTGW